MMSPSSNLQLFFTWFLMMMMMTMTSRESAYNNKSLEQFVAGFGFVFESLFYDDDDGALSSD